MSWVFYGHLKEFMNDINTKYIFGKTAVVIYINNFQISSFPHCHMHVTLKEKYKMREIEELDQVVTTELPDSNLEPDLYA